MRADYLSYRRATSVSILGLVLQVFMMGATLIYGLLSNDHAAVTAAGFIGIGMVAWIALAIIFDQHRRERIEAMEAESLASDPTAGSSVFEARSDEFKVAARRLAGLYKVFVPVVSILIGVLLLAWAIFRFRSGIELVDPARFFVSRHPGWGMGIGLSIAFVGFIFARYASGMAKQAIWQNLRAGASFAVGAALFGLGMVIAQIVDWIGPDSIARYLQVIYPVLAGLIAIEVFLNFVLDIYRPRKAGETPRLSFDSRFLGFVAAPDKIAQSISEAINYQLGFDVTSGWFYKLLSRSVLPLLAVGLLVMWALSALAVVRPHQRATILRFGKPVAENIGPGLHLKAPWPIDTLYVPEYFVSAEKGKRVLKDRTATGLRTIQLGTMPPATTEPLLWTTDHLGEEVFQLVRGGKSLGGGGRTALAQASEGSLTNFAMVSIEAPLQYAVKDVSLYDQLAPPELRDDLLKVVAQRELTLFFQGVDLDDILGPKRAEISAEMRRRVEAAIARLNPDPVTGTPRGAGIEIVFCGIVGIHPPKDRDVAAAFERVVDADQRFVARVDDARAQEIKLLTEAAGDVQTARTLIAEMNALQALETSATKESPETKAKIADQEQKVLRLLDAAGGATASTIASAKAFRWERHMGDRARATRYAGQLAAYQAAPDLFRAAAYFDTLRDSLANSRLYISNSNVDVRVELQDRESGIDVFKPKTEGE
jgi:regulator of protease activity HflC (stomatin/prohibitin superfamily)